ncbi:unnamed protein product [Notodromas monacha]|uniref:AAA+ ATPase domain-containing protein n=1 Tax=Notodromas monacha TaxID=399045 RepID=A0A7R9G9B1_9CRUS|nr:unnamed protein product [Notodromas monacha]CAG0912664.1 unnamed protein product [Notodromas monacha]
MSAVRKPRPPSVPVPPREKAKQNFMTKVLEHRETQARLKKIRDDVRQIYLDYDKSESNLKALQTVGQIVGEVLKPIDAEKFIVKSTNGPRYLVGCRAAVQRDKLKIGTRVALDITTLTIMRALPREVDPLIYSMSHEDPGSVTYASVGGLPEQVRQLREVIELPITNPELFQRVGIKPPKGCLLYGPPGTGKTLLARAIASQMSANFLKVVSSAIVDKYIGESARVIREMFTYARDHEPCIIFMDEIDAIGGRRFSEGTSADREIQRTLMELLNQMDGFDALGQVKIIMATNRPDVLDPALLRPGRLDRKIEIPLPNEQGRLEILRIHAAPITKKGDIGGRRFSEGTSADREIQRTLMELLNQMDGFDALGQVKIIMATNRPDVLDPALLRPGRLDRKIEIPLPNEQGRLVFKLSEGFNGADMRNICTEAGLNAIRGERDFVTDEDFMKAVRKLVETKKLESSMDYKLSS